MDIKIEYSNIPYGITENSLTNFTDRNTTIGTLNDFKTARIVPKYATCELNRNLLDGSFINVPDDTTGYGYASQDVTDQTNSFSSTILITRTYLNNYTTPRINN